MSGGFEYHVAHAEGALSSDIEELIYNPKDRADRLLTACRFVTYASLLGIPKKEDMLGVENAATGKFLRTVENELSKLHADAQKTQRDVSRESVIAHLQSLIQHYATHISQAFSVLEESLRNGAAIKRIASETAHNVALLAQNFSIGMLDDERVLAAEISLEGNELPYSSHFSPEVLQAPSLPVEETIATTDQSSTEKSIPMRAEGAIRLAGTPEQSPEQIWEEVTAAGLNPSEFDLLDARRRIAQEKMIRDHYHPMHIISFDSALDIIRSYEQRAAEIATDIDEKKKAQFKIRGTEPVGNFIDHHLYKEERMKIHESALKKFQEQESIAFMDIDLFIEMHCQNLLDAARSGKWYRSKLLELERELPRSIRNNVTNVHHRARHPFPDNLAGEPQRCIGRENFIIERPMHYAESGDGKEAALDGRISSGFEAAEDCIQWPIQTRHDYDKYHDEVREKTIEFYRSKAKNTEDIEEIFKLECALNEALISIYDRQYEFECLASFPGEGEGYEPPELKPFEWVALQLTEKNDEVGSMGFPTEKIAHLLHPTMQQPHIYKVEFDLYEKEMHKAADEILKEVLQKIHKIQGGTRLADEMRKVTKMFKEHVSTFPESDAITGGVSMVSCIAPAFDQFFGTAPKPILKIVKAYVNPVTLRLVQQATEKNARKYFEREIVRKEGEPEREGREFHVDFAVPCNQEGFLRFLYHNKQQALALCPKAMEQYRNLSDEESRWITDVINTYTDTIENIVRGIHKWPIQTRHDLDAIFTDVIEGISQVSANMSEKCPIKTDELLQDILFNQMRLMALNFSFSIESSYIFPDEKEGYVPPELKPFKWISLNKKNDVSSPDCNVQVPQLKEHKFNVSAIERWARSVIYCAKNCFELNIPNTRRKAVARAGTDLVGKLVEETQTRYPNGIRTREECAEFLQFANKQIRHCILEPLRRVQQRYLMPEEIDAFITSNVDFFQRKFDEEHAASNTVQEHEDTTAPSMDELVAALSERVQAWKDMERDFDAQIAALEHETDASVRAQKLAEIKKKRGFLRGENDQIRAVLHTYLFHIYPHDQR